MRGGGRRAGAVAFCAVIVAVAAAGAAAKTASVRHRTITATVLANCAGQPASQLCPRRAAPPTTFATITVRRAAVNVTYVTGKTHCSQVSLILYVDGTRAGRTGALGPGGRGSVTIHVPADHRAHALAYRARGFVGGCNAGELISVGGEVVVRYVP
jgi:hypothetical protein